MARAGKCNFNLPDFNSVLKPLKQLQRKKRKYRKEFIYIIFRQMTFCKEKKMMTGELEARET